MIRAGAHQLGHVGVSGRRDVYPYVPTVMHTDNSFGAASLLDHPEPARCRVIMWLPAWADPHYMPALGDLVAGSADANGKPVDYFTGTIDAIRAGRLKGKSNPGVMWLNAPSVKVYDYPSVYSQTPTITTLTYSRTGRRNRIVVPPRSDANSTNLGRRTLVVEWTSTSAVHWPNGAAVVVGVPTNRNPLDASSWDSNDVIRHNLDAPSYTVTGSPYGVSTNRTAYPLRTDVAVQPTVTATIPMQLGGLSRVVDLVDPAIVETSGPTTVRGRFVQIDASDFKAPLGRLRIGDRPFPQELPASRWNRVRDLVRRLGIPMMDASLSNKRAGGTLAAAGWDAAIFPTVSGVVRALDIDRRQAREVAERTAMAAGGAVVISASAGIDYQLRPTPVRTLYAPAGDVNAYVGDNVAMSVAPSSIVQEVARVLDSTSIVNQVEVEAVKVASDGEQTDTVIMHADADSISTSGPAALKLASDAALTGSATDVVLSFRARSALRPEATWAFDGDVRITDDDKVTNLDTLLDPQRRHAHALRLDGPTPADVGTDWRVRAGTFTVGKRTDIVLTLDPARWLPDLGVSFQDMDALRWSPKVLFRHMSAVTFAQLQEVDA